MTCKNVKKAKREIVEILFWIMWSLFFYSPVTTTGNQLATLECIGKLTITGLSYDGYSSEIKDIQLPNKLCEDEKASDKKKITTCQFSLKKLYQYDYNENKKTTIQYCCGKPIINLTNT